MQNLGPWGPRGPLGAPWGGFTYVEVYKTRKRNYTLRQRCKDQNLNVFIDKQFRQNEDVWVALVFILNEFNQNPENINMLK
jgi:hypothetical protein